MWIVISVLILLAVYLFIYYILALLETSGPKLIKKDVHGLLKKEVIKLNIRDKPIKWNFWSNNKSTTKLTNGIYEIKFGRKAVKLTVKHEVFHIFRENPNDFELANSGRKRDKLWVKIKYLLWYEFRAKIYTLTDVKL